MKNVKLLKAIGISVFLILVIFLGGCEHKSVKTSTTAAAIEQKIDQINEPMPLVANEMGKEEVGITAKAKRDFSAQKTMAFDSSILTGSSADTECISMPAQIQEHNTEEYASITENDFLDAVKNPLSTFSIDVDKASYSNVRRFINSNQLPYKDVVRIEEMVNYFDYSYAKTTGNEPFSITTEYSKCPWNNENKLVLIGLKGKEIESSEINSNLTFLIDVSGSMEDANKLPLLKSSLKLLVNNLKDNDRVSIVVYASSEGLALPSTMGKDKKKIIEAIENLNAGGSTAGGSGIKLAYKVAVENYIKGGNNRIILATDGDFNVGVSSTSELVKMVEEKRKEGVFLTVIGFGEGNVKDSRMKDIANKGNGEYYYIDNILEAKKVFTDELQGTLFTIAKDVKIQVEFNPAKVASYRLIGYEDRALKREDFDNDEKDAGEMGSGHTVTAIYEITPQKTDVKSDNLKYQTTKVDEAAYKSEELMTINLRYKNPDSDKSQLISKICKTSDYHENMSENLGFASSVAQFGMVLRDSKYKGTSSYKNILEMARKYKGEDKYGYRAEFIMNVEKAQMIAN